MASHDIQQEFCLLTLKHIFVFIVGTLLANCTWQWDGEGRGKQANLGHAVLLKPFKVH